MGKIGTLCHVIVACADCMHSYVVRSAALLAACARKYCAENFLNIILLFITCVTKTLQFDCSSLFL